MALACGVAHNSESEHWHWACGVAYNIPSGTGLRCDIWQLIGASVCVRAGQYISYNSI